MLESYETIFKKSKNNPWQTIDFETIIIDPTNKYSFELNELGSFIWGQLNGKNTLNQIIITILADYDCTPDQLTTDFNSFIEKLIENNLVEKVS